MQKQAVALLLRGLARRLLIPPVMEPSPLSSYSPVTRMQLGAQIRPMLPVTSPQFSGILLTHARWVGWTRVGRYQESNCAIIAWRHLVIVVCLTVCYYSSNRSVQLTWILIFLFHLEQMTQPFAILKVMWYNNCSSTLPVGGFLQDYYFFFFGGGWGGGGGGGGG